MSFSDFREHVKTENYDTFNRFKHESVHSKSGKQNQQPTRRKTFTDTFAQDVDAVFPAHIPKSHPNSPDPNDSVPKPYKPSYSFALSIQKTLIYWLCTIVINSEEVILSCLRARELSYSPHVMANMLGVGAIAGLILLLWGQCFAMTLSVGIGFYVSCWSSLRKYYDRTLSSFVDAIKEYERMYHPKACTNFEYYRFGTHVIEPGELVLVFGEFVQMSDPRNVFAFIRELGRGFLAVAATLYSYNIKCAFCGFLVGKVLYDQFEASKIGTELRTAGQSIPNGKKSELPIWMSMAHFFGCLFVGIGLTLLLGTRSFLLDAFVSSFVGSLCCTCCLLQLARYHGYISVDLDVSIGSNVFLMCFWTAVVCGFLSQSGQLFGGHSVIRALFAPLTFLERLFLRIAVWSFY